MILFCCGAKQMSGSGRQCSGDGLREGTCGLVNALASDDTAEILEM